MLTRAHWHRTGKVMVKTIVVIKGCACDFLQRCQGPVPRPIPKWNDVEWKIWKRLACRTILTTLPRVPLRDLTLSVTWGPSIGPRVSSKWATMSDRSAKSCYVDILIGGWWSDFPRRHHLFWELSTSFMLSWLSVDDEVQRMVCGLIMECGWWRVV